LHQTEDRISSNLLNANNLAGKNRHRVPLALDTFVIGKGERIRFFESITVV